jgi:hypothetical protein
MSKKFGGVDLAEAFHNAEKSLKLDSVGNGSYDLGHDTMAPIGTKGHSGRIQSPAQHAAVKKAAAASVARRRLGRF